MNTEQHRDSEGGRQRSLVMRYAGMGLELAASVIGLTLAGLWIDHAFGTRPLWLLIGVGVGTVGGLYNLIHAALRMTSETRYGQRADQECRSNDRHDRP